jgi:DNA (cytosine-5)-methyltransferase 1
MHRTEGQAQASQGAMTSLTVLELFTGIGGSAWGYHLAGFNVIGSDWADFSAKYPRPMKWGGTMPWQEALDRYAGVVDLLHASPPCQFASGMCDSRPGLAETYPNLIPAVREAFEDTGLPYVIENVEKARPWLKDPVMTCGWTMGRDLYQHHLWESNLPLRQEPHRRHVTRASKAGHFEPGTFISVAGHCAPIAEARRVMEITWGNREELAEAVPPYMAQFIGEWAASCLSLRRFAEVILK